MHEKIPFCLNTKIKIQKLHFVSVELTRLLLWMLQHYSKKKKKSLIITAWKVSKYGVFYGSYFPVFGLVDLCERIIQILGEVGGVQYNWLKFYFYHLNKISSIQNEYLKIILVLSILVEQIISLFFIIVIN